MFPTTPEVYNRNFVVLPSQFITIQLQATHQVDRAHLEGVGSRSFQAGHEALSRNELKECGPRSLGTTQHERHGAWLKPALGLGLKSAIFEHASALVAMLDVT